MADDRPTWPRSVEALDKLHGRREAIPTIPDDAPAAWPGPRYYCPRYPARDPSDSPCSWSGTSGRYDAPEAGATCPSCGATIIDRQAAVPDAVQRERAGAVTFNPDDIDVPTVTRRAAADELAARRARQVDDDRYVTAAFKHIGTEPELVTAARTSMVAIVGHVLGIDPALAAKLTTVVPAEFDGTIVSWFSRLNADAVERLVALAALIPDGVTALPGALTEREAQVLAVLAADWLTGEDISARVGFVATAELRALWRRGLAINVGGDWRRL